MVLFTDENGTPIHKEDRFDPETGENLAINEFISDVAKKGRKVTPVRIFQDFKNNKQVYVPYGQEKKFVELGLKPVEQLEAEESSTQAHNKLMRGETGYHPNETESFWNSALDTATANIRPQLAGVAGGVENTLKGGSFGRGFEEAKDISQAQHMNRERENPITSMLGSTAGSLATLGATGGATSIPRMIAAGAGLGGLNETEKGFNQDKSLGEIGNEAFEGATEGGAGALAGGLVGKGIQKAAEGLGKAGYGFIPSSVKKGFKEGIEGTDLANPEVNRAIQTRGSTLARDVQDIIYGKGGIKSEVGQAKGDILEALKNNPNISHNELNDLINKEQFNIVKAYDRTKYTDERESLNHAYNLLEEAKGTLDLNPNDPVEIDKAKQMLGELQYNKDKPIKNSRDAKNSINNVREKAKSYLEGLADNLQGTNQSYKTLLDADEADILNSARFTPEDITSLGKEAPTASVLNKIDNFKRLNDTLQGNPHLPQELKIKMNDILNKINRFSDQTETARSVAKGGFPNLANQIGYGAHRFSNALEDFTPDALKPVKNAVGETIYGIPTATYKSLPLQIQELIRLNPEYREKFKR